MLSQHSFIRLTSKDMLSRKPGIGDLLIRYTKMSYQLLSGELGDRDDVRGSVCQNFLQSLVIIPIRARISFWGAEWSGIVDCDDMAFMENRSAAAGCKQQTAMCMQGKVELLPKLPGEMPSLPNPQRRPRRKLSCIFRDQNGHRDGFECPRAQQDVEGGQQFVCISLHAGDRLRKKSSIYRYRSERWARILH
jgi:hypothetical protein